MAALQPLLQEAIIANTPTRSEQTPSLRVSDSIKRINSAFVGISTFQTMLEQIDDCGDLSGTGLAVLLRPHINNLFDATGELELAVNQIISTTVGASK